MNILSFDTSNSTTSVCLAYDNRIIESINKINQENHDSSTNLTPLISDILKNNNLTIKQLDIIACGIGPGSFTGVRTAVVTARTFAQIINKPLIDINTFEAIYSIQNNLSSMVILKAYKNHSYISILDGDKYILEPMCVSYDEIDSLIKKFSFDKIIIDKSCEYIISDFNKNIELLDLSNVNLSVEIAKIAYHKIKDFNNNKSKNYYKNIEQVLPLYLKEPSITLKTVI